MLVKRSLLGMALIGSAILANIVLMSQQKAEQSNVAKPSAAPAMTMVIDANTGMLRTPTAADFKEIATQKEKITSKKPKVHYSNTMKQYADGTRTGVVDPSHMHNIYASIDADGNLVIIEHC